MNTLGRMAARLTIMWRSNLYLPLMKMIPENLDITNQSISPRGLR